MTLQAADPRAWDAPLTLGPSGVLISAARRVDGLTAERVLQHAAGRERFYLRTPDGASEGVAALAGFGTAASLFGYGVSRMQTIEAQARALFANAQFDPLAPPTARPRLFGGFAFRDDFVPDEAWSAFHPAHFLLPHVQFAQDAGADSGWLTIAALTSPGESVTSVRLALADALQAYETLLLSAPTPATTPAPAETHTRYPMNATAWDDLVSHALSEIEAGRIVKVVLARACELRRTSGFNLAGALAQLNANYPECYRFLFEPRPGHAFLGATPELLASVRRHTLHTMALAGSQARGASPAEDDALAAALLASDKDRREHRLVLDALVERLRLLSHDLAHDETQVMKLHNIQHLHTPVRAELHADVSMLDALAALHPTPALGGSPRITALRFIVDNEPLTRGWYAAPVGWLDADINGLFCVTIRSAVVQQTRAWLYAGCGIVAGSIPQREWDETDLKFRPMLRALSNTPPPTGNS
ncbi:MAG: isochorismate synthase [Chloroflexi bacterium]|nr:isochorismate synthase [Chloroflexota bacterium]